MADDSPATSYSRDVQRGVMDFSLAQRIELMRAVLGKGGTWRFCAWGKSMRPFIREGDTVTLGPVWHQDRRPTPLAGAPSSLSRSAARKIWLM